MSATAKQELDLSGVEGTYHPVVMQYGREMFDLVMGAGLASEAMNRLANFAKKQRSAEMQAALIILSKQFNHVATRLARSQGWTEELLAQCDRDCQLAFAGKVQVAGSKIILDA